MMGVYLLICLAIDPSICKEVQVATNVPLQACMTNMPGIAEAMTDYPGYVLKAWRCKSGNPA